MANANEINVYHTGGMIPIPAPSGVNPGGYSGAYFYDGNPRILQRVQLAAKGELEKSLVSNAELSAITRLVNGLQLPPAVLKSFITDPANDRYSHMATTIVSDIDPEALTVQCCHKHSSAISRLVNVPLTLADTQLLHRIYSKGDKACVKSFVGEADFRRIKKVFEQYALPESYLARMNCEGHVGDCHTGDCTKCVAYHSNNAPAAPISAGFNVTYHVNGVPNRLPCCWGFHSHVTPVVDEAWIAALSALKIAYSLGADSQLRYIVSRATYESIETVVERHGLNLLYLGNFEVRDIKPPVPAPVVDNVMMSRSLSASTMANQMEANITAAGNNVAVSSNVAPSGVAPSGVASGGVAPNTGACPAPSATGKVTTHWLMMTDNVATGHTVTANRAATDKAATDKAATDKAATGNVAVGGTATITLQPVTQLITCRDGKEITVPCVWNLPAMVPFVSDTVANAVYLYNSTCICAFSIPERAEYFELRRFLKLYNITVKGTLRLSDGIEDRQVHVDDRSAVYLLKMTLHFKRRTPIEVFRAELPTAVLREVVKSRKTEFYEAGFGVAIDALLGENTYYNYTARSKLVICMLLGVPSDALEYIVSIISVPPVDQDTALILGHWDAYEKNGSVQVEKLVSDISNAPATTIDNNTYAWLFKINTDKKTPVYDYVRQRSQQGNC